MKLTSLVSALCALAPTSLSCATIAAAPAPSAELIVQTGHGYGVVGLAASPDGRLLAAAEHYSGLVKVWDLASGLQLKTFRMERDAPSVAFDAAGDLVIADVNQVVSVYDPASGAARRHLQRQTWGGFAVMNLQAAMAIAGDGTIAAGGFMGEHLAADAQAGVCNADAMPNADAMKLFGTPRAVRVWPAPGAPPFAIPMPEGGSAQVTSLAFSPDGSWLAVGLDDGRLLGVDLRARAVRWATPLPGARIMDGGDSLLWSDDGGALARATGEQLWIVDAKGRVRHQRGLDAPARGLAAGGRGELVVAAGDKLEIRSWRDGALRGARSFDRVIGALTALPGDRRYALAVGGEVVVWDAAAGQEIRRLGARNTGMAMAAMSGSDRTLLVAEDDRLTRWRLDTDGVTPFEARLPGAVRHVAGGGGAGRPALVLSRRDDAEWISAVDAERASIRWSRQLAGRGESPALAPDGRVVAVLEGRRRVRFFEVDTGRDVSSMDIDHAYALVFDGADTLLTVANRGPRGTPIRRWRWRSGEPGLLAEVEEQGPVTELALSHVGRFLAWSYPEGGRVGVADLDSGSAHALDCVNGRVLAFSPVEPLLAVGTGLGEVVMYDVGRRVELRRLQISDAIVDTLSFSADGLRLIAGARDGSVHVLSLTGRLATAFFKDEARVAFTDAGYYTGDRAAMGAIAFRIDRRAYPFEQLDLEFHRPDLVLARLGGDPQLIAAYEAAWRRRMQRMDASDVRVARPPAITVDRTGVPLATDSPAITVRVEARDDAEPLRSLHVFANDVPIYGAAGRALETEAGETWRGAVEVPLTQAETKLQVFVRNAAGVDSLRETFEVRRTGAPPARDLYVVAIGVTEYADPTMRLPFAGKDARDVSGLLAAAGAGRYRRVHVERLVDAQASRAAVLGLRALLQKARPEDEVVVFIAGHGVLDEQLTYRFATADFDFARPSAGGVTFDELEGLLDGVPPRRKLLMMDTCHAGELDAADVEWVAALPGALPPTTFARSPLAVGAPMIAAPARAQLLESHFVDLRRGAGATVLAAAGGAELAFESGEWRNGAFTFALRRGLECGAADADGDGVVEVRELLGYTAGEVARMTDGRQRPVARRLNQTHDYGLMAVPSTPPAACGAAPAD